MSTKIEDALNQILAHHGVRGMKWGVRKRRSGVVSKSSETKHISEDAKAAQEAKTKAKTHGTHALSNKELQHLVNRINLEQQYSRLKKGKPNPGAKFAKEILVGVGKAHITKIASDALGKQISGALKKKDG